MWKDEVWGGGSFVGVGVVLDKMGGMHRCEDAGVWQRGRCDGRWPKKKLNQCEGAPYNDGTT